MSAVDHDQQPADTLVRGGLQRLPVLAFLQLSVTRHHDHPAATAEVALRPGDPTGFRDPHSERSGVGLDPRHADVRVAVEAAIGLTWHRFVGDHGEIVSIEHYGASADYKTLYQKFGLTTDAIVEAARRSLSRTSA